MGVGVGVGVGTGVGVGFTTGGVTGVVVVSVVSDEDSVWSLESEESFSQLRVNCNNNKRINSFFIF